MIFDCLLVLMKDMYVGQSMHFPGCKFLRGMVMLLF